MSKRKTTTPRTTPPAEAGGATPDDRAARVRAVIIRAARAEAEAGAASALRTLVDRVGAAAVARTLAGIVANDVADFATADDLRGRLLKIARELHQAEAEAPEAEEGGPDA